MIAASKGYGFLCVTDPRCNLQTRLLMEALGAEVHVVTEVADPARGLLGARMDHVRARCAADPRYVWLNQYENQHNWQAHHRQTAPAIDRQFPQLDVLFVGAGTTGTLMGCARWFREHRPSVRIVAVDPAGSVSFGGPASPRMIPGLGMAVRPPLLDESYVDEGWWRRRWTPSAPATGWPGAASCSVARPAPWSAGRRSGWPATGENGGRELTAVTIAPDLGERYLDTVYQPNWVADVYGEDLLGSLEHDVAPAPASPPPIPVPRVPVHAAVGSEVA
jgi:cysteine synthase A